MLARTWPRSVPSALLLCAWPQLLGAGSSSGSLLTENGTSGPLRSKCPTPAARARPLLWVASRGDQKGFVAGVLDVPAKGVLPLPPAMERSLGCADVAVFEEACSRTDAEVANFSVHCRSYQQGSEADSDGASLVDRLPMATLSDLAASLASFLNSSLPASLPQCAGEVGELRAAVEELRSAGSATTLRALLGQLLHILGPRGCVSHGDAGGGASQSYEDLLRATFGASRPSFGLVDIDDRCKWLRDASAAEDAQLAEQISARFSDQHWVDQQTILAKELTDALRCGDVDKVQQVVADSELTLDSWRSSSAMSQMSAQLQLSAQLASGIERTFEQHPGKVVFAAVGAAHLFGDHGVLKLLAESGFDVKEAADATVQGCKASQYAAPGARQLGHCLMPPDLAQPASCDEFALHMAAVLESDPLHGRRTSHKRCAGCLTSLTRCGCNVTWENDTAFVELCEGTKVSGTSGQVLEMDFTRNPGSHHATGSRAEKTVRSLYQKCYATTCNQDAIALGALRKWHAGDPTLAHGSVVLHAWHGASLTATTSGAPPAEPPWAGPVRRWLSWPVLWIGVCCCLAAAALVYCAFCRRGRRRKSQRRKATSAVPDAPPPSMKAARQPGFVAVAQDDWNEGLPLNSEYQEGSLPSMPSVPREPAVAPVWLPVFSRAVQMQQALRDAGESAAVQIRSAFDSSKAQSFQPMEIGSASPRASQAWPSPRQPVLRSFRN